jgi:hypothetical protein
MFRTRSKLATGVFAIAVLVALYSVAWLVLAHRTRAVIDDYVASERARGLALTFAHETIGGFPLRLQVGFDDVAADGLPHGVDGRLTAPAVIAWSWAWQLDGWHLRLPQGATLTTGEGRIAVGSATGSGGAVLGPGATPGGDRVEIACDDLQVGDGTRQISADKAAFTLRVPPTAPHAHEEALFSLSLKASRISLPDVPALGRQLDHLALDATWRGAVPPGKLADALGAWRDDGGTVDVQGVDMGWGGLSVTGDGTMALDKNLQPMAAFSARVTGYDAALDALAAVGGLKPNEVAMARMGLSLMTQRGADGTPQLKTPITIQDGGLFVGPARLLKLPKIAW